MEKGGKMGAEELKESAYLELKGLIIDWAMEFEPQIEPKDVIVMLKRFIEGLERRAGE